MDLKLIYAGDEPSMSNPDLMFTQYSNYFGLQGMGQGLDCNDSNIVITGCELSGTFINGTGIATISIADGYIVMNNETIKVDTTPDLTFNPTFTGATATYYIFANKLVRFNPLGDKTYINETYHETWKETRITLTSSLSSTELNDAVLLGSVVFTSGIDGATITTTITDAQTQAVIKKEVSDINSTTLTRDGRNSEIVTPNALYDVMGNWQLLTLRSVAKNVVSNDTILTFILPLSVVGLQLTSCTLLTQQPSGGAVDYYIGYGATSTSPQAFKWYPTTGTVEINIPTSGIPTIGSGVAMFMVNYFTEL